MTWDGMMWLQRIEWRIGQWYGAAFAAQNHGDTAELAQAWWIIHELKEGRKVAGA